MQALAKPEVGDFLSKHFVCVYDKVGSFSVSIGGDGKTANRNGGNVAAFFCTPNGNVIHASAGPRTAEAFLAEASWAKGVFSEITSERRLAAGARRNDRVAAALREAHVRAFELMSRSAAGDPGQLGLPVPPSDPNLKALYEAGRKQRHQVHALLRQYAFESLGIVGPKVYMEVLGEMVSADPVRLTTAPEAKQGAPQGTTLKEFLTKQGRSIDRP